MEQKIPKVTTIFVWFFILAPFSVKLYILIHFAGGTIFFPCILGPMIYPIISSIYKFFFTKQKLKKQKLARDWGAAIDRYADRPKLLIIVFIIAFLAASFGAIIQISLFYLFCYFKLFILALALELFNIGYSIIKNKTKPNNTT